MTSAYALSQIMVSGILVLIVATLWSRFLAERFRSRVRLIRDDLFDWMIENQQSFESKPYREVRQTLNGIMRLSNSFGPIELLVMMGLVMHHRRASQVNAVEMMPASLLKEKLQSVKVDAVREWMRFLFLEGVFGACVKVVWTLCRAVSRLAELQAAVTSFGDEALRAAHAFGAATLTGTQRTLLAR